MLHKPTDKDKIETVTLPEFQEDSFYTLTRNKSREVRESVVSAEKIGELNRIRQAITTAANKGLTGVDVTAKFKSTIKDFRNMGFICFEVDNNPAVNFHISWE